MKKEPEIGFGVRPWSVGLLVRGEFVPVARFATYRDAYMYLCDSLNYFDNHDCSYNSLYLVKDSVQ